MQLEFFTGKQLDLTAFVGTWHIAHTSLPFWHGKFNPMVTYTLGGAYSKTKMLDEVRYTDTHGKEHVIVGYDRLLNDNDSLFEWIAKPWYLRFLKSIWGVVAHDAQYQQWAVTCFSKTTFTPAGMDIYTRTPELSDDAYHEIVSKIADVEFLRPYCEGLYRTARI